MIQQPRLPYVRFTSDVHEAKDAEGHIKRTMVYTVHVTPAGGKDEFVQNADEWLKALLEKGYTRGPFDEAANEYGRWHEHFSKMFAQFKAGEEMTYPGTPLRACLAFMKTEVKQAEDAKIFSLEDLAACNEEGMARMGIGARALRDKAQQLLASTGSNRQAEELAAAHVRMEALEQRIADLIASGAVEKRRVGRPRKEPAE